MNDGSQGVEQASARSPSPAAWAREKSHDREGANIFIDENIPRSHFQFTESPNGADGHIPKPALPPASSSTYNPNDLRSLRTDQLFKIEIFTLPLLLPAKIPSNSADLCGLSKSRLSAHAPRRTAPGTTYIRIYGSKNPNSIESAQFWADKCQSNCYYLSEMYGFRLWISHRSAQLSSPKISISRILTGQIPTHRSRAGRHQNSTTGAPNP